VRSNVQRLNSRCTFERKYHDQKTISAAPGKQPIPAATVEDDAWPL